VASHSSNLNKFAKVMHNVVSSSPLHSKGIGLEGDAHLMYVRRKLDGNFHRLHKSVFTINIPMRNRSFAPMHSSPNPLCAPFMAFCASVGTIGDYNFNISHGKILASTLTHFESHHVPTIPSNVVIQFGILVVENYVPPNRSHFQRTNCCLCKWCCWCIGLNRFCTCSWHTSYYTNN
jgi:hypothetical protein